MTRRGWDLLLFYGDTWRKDHFRCLVSVCFSGPQALALLTKEGEVRAVVTHPWDVEPVKAATGGAVTYAPRLVEGLKSRCAMPARRSSPSTASSRWKRVSCAP